LPELGGKVFKGFWMWSLKRKIKRAAEKPPFIV